MARRRRGTELLWVIGGGAAGLMLVAGAVTAHAEPTTTTTATTSTLEPTTTTTDVCPAIARLSGVELTPSTFAPGQRVHVIGYLSTGVRQGCREVGFDGPHPILLLIDGQVITLDVVDLVDGQVDTDLVIPAWITARGPGQVVFDVAPAVPQLAQRVTVVDPAHPGPAVPVVPQLTG